jgi:hypothetical protein
VAEKGNHSPPDYTGNETVGWALSRTLEADLAIATPRMALRRVIALTSGYAYAGS